MRPSFRQSSQGVPRTTRLDQTFSRQVMEGKSGQLVSGRIGEHTRSHWQKTANAHWRNLSEQILSLLGDTGVSDIHSGGSRKISFSTVAGRRITIKTNNWKRLNRKYARRKPVSRVFWKKTGRLSRAVANSLGRTSGVKVGNVRSRRVGQHQVKVTASIRYPGISDPLASFIRAPFITGVENSGNTFATKGFTGNRDTIWRVIFPESQRPFIKRVSARLGKEQRKALERLATERKVTK